MIYHIWSVLCRTSSVNTDNNLSIQDILEVLNVEIRPQNIGDEPASLPVDLAMDYQLITFLGKDTPSKATGTVELELVRPDGEVTNRFAQDVVIPDGGERSRVVFQIQGFTVSTAGEYVFRVQLRQDDDAPKTVASIPLQVKVAVGEA